MTVWQQRTLAAIAVFAVTAFAACGGGGERARFTDASLDAAIKTAAVQRAERRAYEGAPPVIPHEPFGSPCLSCHNDMGVAVPGVGYAPPSPHEITRGLSATSRCQQCHVFQRSEESFVRNRFVGWQQDLRAGQRLHPGAPPVMPHVVFMRENCRACHSGPAAREEIRTSHPDRPRCQQCHMEQRTTESFGGQS